MENEQPQKQGETPTTPPKQDRKMAITVLIVLVAISAGFFYLIKDRADVSPDSAEANDTNETIQSVSEPSQLLPEDVIQDGKGPRDADIF